MESKSNGKTQSTKTFSLAVGISLTMILIACIVSYPQVIPQDVDDGLAEVSDEVTTVTETSPLDDLVDNLVTNVPKETTTTTVTTTTEATQLETYMETQSTSVPIDGYATIMPIANGEVLAEFSEGELVKSSTSGIWQTHNGIDVLADVNTPVQAVDDGTVTKVYEDALLGVCVTIDHTDFTANYCNLDFGVLVTEGDTVEKGSIIGTVGDTSVSEASLDSHLHFETLQGGSFVNPLGLLQR